MVFNFLKSGAENAISADELAVLMGTTPRGLRSQIMRARDAGEIIPAGMAGIFCQHSMKSRPELKCWLFTTFRPHVANMG